MKVSERLVAKCRERSSVSAAMNGHGAVWPQADVVFKNGMATFKRDGRKVWQCNEAYARVHFEVSQKEEA